MGSPVFKDEYWFCDICEFMLSGRRAYEEHLDGKKHKQHLKKKRTAEDSITNGLAQTNLGAISVNQAAPALAAAKPNAASGLGSHTSENSITHDEAGGWHFAEAGDWHLAYFAPLELIQLESNIADM